MAWTVPMTAIAGELWTASDFNVHVRDNLNETMPAKALTNSLPFYDFFENRTVSPGWGTAESGGAWAHSEVDGTTPTTTDTQFSVADGRGIITANQTGIAYLARHDVGSTNMDISAEFQTTAESNFTQGMIVGGNAACDTGFVTTFDTDADTDAEHIALGVTIGTISGYTFVGVISFFVHYPRTQHVSFYTYGLRMRVRDNILKIKLWVKNLEPEPDQWQKELINDGVITQGTFISTYAAVQPSGTVPQDLYYNYIIANGERLTFQTTGTNEIAETNLNSLPVNGTGDTVAAVAYNPMTILVKGTGSQQSIPPATDTVVTDWVQTSRNDVFDTTGLTMFVAGGTNELLTIQVDGTYDIGFTGRFTSGVGRRNLYILINGSDTATASEFAAETFEGTASVLGGITPMYISSRFQLVAGDVVRFGVFHNNGTTLDFGSGGIPDFQANMYGWVRQVPDYIEVT